MKPLLVIGVIAIALSTGTARSAQSVFVCDQLVEHDYPDHPGMSERELSKRAEAFRKCREQPAEAVQISRAVAKDGAIFCRDWFHLKSVLDRMLAYVGDAMQDRVTGGQAQRYRGPSIPRPNPADYGCITLPGRTPMTVERGHEMTVIVELPDGRTLRGVTHPDMIKQ